MTRLLPLALATALALGGCGGGDDGDGSRGGEGAASDVRAARDAVVRHFRAIEAGDGAAACAELSPAGRRRLESDLRAVGTEGGCEQGVLETEVPELRVERVLVRGDRATVVLAGGLEYEVERVDGAWKLSG